MYTVEPIATIRTPFKTKFGVPKQPNCLIEGQIIFEPKYSTADAIRGLEDYSHLWLIWLFSEVEYQEFMPTVRPPILGGNVRKGVFATRSPFRPNRLGLSSVKIKDIGEHSITVLGADMVDKTPIIDIKPYIPGYDTHADAKMGFTYPKKELELTFPTELLAKVPVELQAALCSVLQSDPRPSYHTDVNRVYGFYFGEQEIKFQVATGTVTVVGVE